MFGGVDWNWEKFNTNVSLTQIAEEHFLHILVCLGIQLSI
jgi:hypothetical protein